LGSGGFTKRKKLGQHFLTDPSITERIVDESGVTPDGRVLEIGPGRGILTRALLHAGAVVHAVELDAELYARLAEDTRGEENLTLERGNALRFDFGSFEAPYAIVSNLPYSVATALLKKFIENARFISSMTLMVQAEVGERITAKPGGAHYGSFSVYAGYHLETSYLFTVPPDAFRPRPKVNSAVIRLVPRKTPPVELDDEDEFFRFVHTAFTHRRKTMRNNLKKLWQGPEPVEDVLLKAGINPTARPEEVSLEKFAGLYGIFGGKD
jgi:16S rRNA (adenine1518-N6/adenine1519-N6)-dimethyltransferase